MIDVGATATRRGLTSHQQAGIYRWLLSDHRHISRLHHGMCVGGDEEFNDMAREIGIWTVGHPPEDNRFLMKGFVDEVLEPKPYLARDKDIVAEVSTLFVAPFQDEEPASYRGSGTWATYGYAKASKLRVVIFWPTLPFEIRPFDLEDYDGQARN